MDAGNLISSLHKSFVCFRGLPTTRSIAAVNNKASWLNAKKSLRQKLKNSLNWQAHLFSSLVFLRLYSNLRPRQSTAGYGVACDRPSSSRQIRTSFVGSSSMLLGRERTVIRHVRRALPMLLRGVGELAAMYRYFTLDQYGVMHDGRSAYPGAADALARLCAAGGQALILSNYAGRAETQRARLLKIGLNPDDLAGPVGVVTSGELAHRHLLEHRDQLGGRVLWIAWADRRGRGLGDFFDGLDDYTLADSVESADFILVSGVESIFAGTTAETAPTSFERDGDFSAFLAVFQRAIERGLPLLCANPDIRVMRPWGKGYLGGGLAEKYESMGGKVLYLGKPHALAFQEARRMLIEVGADAGDKICHVGDSLHHDVEGAAAAGLDAAFVVQPGLHAAELPDVPTAEEVALLCEREGAPVPQVYIRRFAW